MNIAPKTDEELAIKSQLAETESMNVLCATNAEYDECANFSKCTVESISTERLQEIRFRYMAVPLGLIISYNICEAIYRNPWALKDFVYYLSQWGCLFSFFSVIASMKAVTKGGEWQSIAVIAMELAISLNFIITPVGWMWICTYQYFDPEWPGWAPKWRPIFTIDHTIPILTVASNLYLTDMVTLKKDTKLVFFMGMVYMVVNCIAQFDKGTPIYAMANWNSPISAIIGLTFVAACLSMVNYAGALFLQKKRNHKEY